MEDEMTYTQEGELRTEDVRQQMDELRDEKSRANTLMIVFLALFLLSLGLLVYYQFYQGAGKWKFSFQHKGVVVQDEAATAKMASLEARNDSLKSVVGTMQQNMNASNARPDATGTVYEVQIGAFRAFDPSKYSNNMANMQMDKEDGYNKLTVGIFNSYAEAAAFKKDMQQVGIRRAWIVKKVNGERQKISKEETR